MLVNGDSICCSLASLNGSPKVPSNSDAFRGQSISIAGESITCGFRTVFAKARDPQINEQQTKALLQRHRNLKMMTCGLTQRRQKLHFAKTTIQFMNPF
jgi:hypothetical protein